MAGEIECAIYDGVSCKQDAMPWKPCNSITNGMGVARPNQFNPHFTIVKDHSFRKVDGWVFVF